MTGHTPGPWKVLKVGNQWAVVKAKAKRGDDDICTGSVYHDDYEANARLIASAPELLDALKGAKAALELALPTLRHVSPNANWSDISKMAEVAGVIIAKVEKDR